MWPAGNAVLRGGNVLLIAGRAIDRRRRSVTLCRLKPCRDRRAIPFPTRHDLCLLAPRPLSLAPSAAQSGQAFMRRISISVGRAVFVALIGTLGAGPIIGMARAAEDAPQITVAVASGRTFGGAIDSQTDHEVLWLRTVSGPITLRRPIDWDRVLHGSRDGRELSADELRAAAERWKASLPKSEPLIRQSHNSSDQPSPRPPEPASDSLWTPPAPPAMLQSPGARHAAAVASLQIDAELGHWTPGVESSGIVIHVWPLDADGRLAPIDGTLEVDLIGTQFGGPTVGDDRGTNFPNLGRWTEAVRAADCGPSGAAYRLAFQAKHPEFDTEIQPHAIVHARLTVPGQGVFETSQGMVRIRPYDAQRRPAARGDGGSVFPGGADGPVSPSGGGGCYSAEKGETASGWRPRRQFYILLATRHSPLMTRHYPPGFFIARLCRIITEPIDISDQPSQDGGRTCL